MKTKYVSSALLNEVAMSDMRLVSTWYWLVWIKIRLAVSVKYTSKA